MSIAETKYCPKCGLKLVQLNEVVKLCPKCDVKIKNKQENL